MVYTREHSPEGWAATQNTLGLALMALGDRSVGAEGAGQLRDAVDAFREALKVHTREHFPQYWARTQSNLGLALRVLGERSGGSDGAQHLRDAVDAFREALKVYTRESLPQGWARTQYNLGDALRVLGVRSGGAEGAQHLRDALAGYGQALKVQTREHLPQDWATTQFRLGLALAVLGVRSGGPEGARQLQDAAAAFREALKVYTREHFPQDWAAAQAGLGLALAALGRLSTGETRRTNFAEAIGCYSWALAVVTRDSAPQAWRVMSRELHQVEVDLYLEGGEWEKAAEAGRKLAELGPGPAGQSRAVTAGLGTGDFEGSLKRADALLATEAVRKDPDAVAELQVARLLCLAALGRKPEAAKTAAALAEHVGKQPRAFRPTGPWIGLRNYVEKSGDGGVAASRGWLLACLNAARREGRDEVVQALRDLPALK
jgi:tetratricopeptide (TPR) repeat protein